MGCEWQTTCVRQIRTRQSVGQGSQGEESAPPDGPEPIASFALGHFRPPAPLLLYGPILGNARIHHCLEWPMFRGHVARALLLCVVGAGLAACARSARAVPGRQVATIPL